jgi:acetoin utilization deacetylase AcuC-like enzyme
VLYVDLDAHQGNGVERDFLDDPNTYVLDAYNPHIYPGDTDAKGAIRATIHFKAHDTGAWFLPKLRQALRKAIRDFQPQLVLYNAGTDCLEGDPLGDLSLSPASICHRDRIVMEECWMGASSTGDGGAREEGGAGAADVWLDGSRDGAESLPRVLYEPWPAHGIPVAMVLSGGYQHSNAGVIAESLHHLLNVRCANGAALDSAHVSVGEQG